MSSQGSSLIERLSEAKSPFQLREWKDGDYVAMCRVSADDVPGLIEIVKKWSDPDWPGDAEWAQSDPDEAAMLPVTAWRILGDLQAVAAVEPLIEMLCDLEDEDDWVFEELPEVFAKLGEPAIGPLSRVANDKVQEDFVRQVAASGLCSIAQRLPETRDRVVGVLADLMSRAKDHSVDLNTSLLCELVDLNAAEAAEPIERAFADDLVDVGMLGDWEDVRRELGVAGLGLEMPNRPHDSRAQLRLRLGVGIFSKKPLFFRDELDEEAEGAYYDRAEAVFSKSEEAKRFVETHGDLGWYQTLLRHGLHNLGEAVDGMSLSSVKQFLLGYVPKSVSVEADEAGTIVAELTLFWQFLDRVYQVPAAKSIVEWLQTKGLVAHLHEAMSNPDNFGMAKSFYMGGMQAGYDMNSDQGRAAFMKVYNDRIARMNNPVSSGGSDGVGRNDACPCGSGKKFKKCCGRRA